MFGVVKFAIALGLIFGICSAPCSADQKDFAFVVGNSNYESVSPLSNPANDATLIAKNFEDLGFEVDLHFDLSHSEFIQAVQSFRRKSRNAERTVVYYAGHGIEFDGKNYIIPTNATLESDIDVDFETIQLEFLVANTPASAVQIVIIDACRDNPFYGTMERSTRSSAKRGLARVEPTGNTLIAYAAKAGTVAFDGDSQNSPYAMALSDALTRPGLDIGRLFREVRASVLLDTGNRQEPVTYGSLPPEDVFFNPPVVSQPASPPDTSLETKGLQASGENPAIQRELDLEFWKSVSEQGSLEDYRLYLDQFPKGVFSSVALRRIEQLETANEPSGPVDPEKKDQEAALSDQLDSFPSETSLFCKEGEEFLASFNELRPSQSNYFRSTYAECPSLLISLSRREISPNSASTSDEEQSEPISGAEQLVDVDEIEKRLGLSNGDRREIQQRLNSLSYGPLGVDGVFGPRTRAAIANWQRANGLRDTGYVNRDHIRLLKNQSESSYSELLASQRALEKNAPRTPPSTPGTQQTETSRSQTANIDEAKSSTFYCYMDASISAFGLGSGLFTSTQRTESLARQEVLSICGSKTGFPGRCSVRPITCKENFR